MNMGLSMKENQKNYGYMTTAAGLASKYNFSSVGGAVHKFNPPRELVAYCLEVFKTLQSNCNRQFEHARQIGQMPNYAFLNDPTCSDNVCQPLETTQNILVIV